MKLSIDDQLKLIKVEASLDRLEVIFSNDCFWRLSEKPHTTPSGVLVWVHEPAIDTVEVVHPCTCHLASYLEYEWDCIENYE